jgi:hypothetical protein
MYVIAQFFGMIMGVAFLRDCTHDNLMSTGCFAVYVVHARCQ